MNVMIVLVVLAMAASCHGSYLLEQRMSKLIEEGIINPDGVDMDEETKNFRNELFQEKSKRDSCPGVECSYEKGTVVVNCIVRTCMPTFYYTQKCVHVSSATREPPCYYKHKPANTDAEYPGCCETYTSLCEGQAGYQASELPKYTPEEIEECERTPIMIA